MHVVAEPFLFRGRPVSCVAALRDSRPVLQRDARARTLATLSSCVR